MTSNGDNSNAAIKALLAGLAGYIGWRALGPQRQEKVLSFLDSLAEAVSEAERRKQMAQAQARQQRETQAIMQALLSFPAKPVSESPSLEPIHLDLPSLISGPVSKREVESSKAITESDAQWRSVIAPPAVVLIVGKRGSGKSALAYRLVELFRYSLRPYVVGAPAQARKLLPEWIGLAPSLEELPPKSITLVDEAYLHYHSRRSMAEESRTMSQMLNLSRQREQTLVFVSQEARQVDRNVASSASVVVFKELGILQHEFERKELHKIAQQAQEAFASKRGNKRRWSYVYSPDVDFMGLLESELPSFWKPGLSRLFGSGTTPTAPRSGKKTSPQEKAQKARELRTQGFSYGEIAKTLGVSKSTVVNYLRDYPYR